MNKHKLIIQYDGTLFLGWQTQKEYSPTVQDTVNSALYKIYKKEVKTIGSGRTDTGVHALEQHVAFTPPFKIESSNLVAALNSNLPSTIRVLECIEVSNEFRPTNDAAAKEYRYLFSNLADATAFQTKYIVNYSYELDFDLMREACRLFEGKHDFSSFQCVGSDVSSTIRSVFECELLKHDSDFHGIFPSHYYLRIVGSGFLKQMVRLVMGAVWKVGRGKLSLDDLDKAINQPTGKHVSAVAPPQGLYKYSVEYPKDTLTIT